jgi:hypothetical protein
VKKPTCGVFVILLCLCLMFASPPALAQRVTPSTLLPAEVPDSQVQPAADPPLPSAELDLPALTSSPVISRMIGQVQQRNVSAYDADLSGERPVIVGGFPYTLTTRNTRSGTPIDRATLYAYERFQSAGLSVSFNYYTACSLSNRNVVGILPGATSPTEIVLITAHIDDMPSTGRAPGADDNASGSTAVLVAADIMSRYRFGRTVRFVLFTGEEQGLCGSAAYAAEASSQGDDIRAVVNLDMIGYNSDVWPIFDLYTRSNITGAVALAATFSQTVGAYGLNLTPNIFVDASLGNYSDNKSFWDQGYTAILAIEDDDDFTPYYHTSNDRITTLNMPYFTELVKASIGTMAYLANPIFNAPDVSPVTLAQTGEPGAIVTYTLQVSNTNSIDDTFDMAVAGNAWMVTPTMPVGPVPAYTAIPVMLTVRIPPNTLRGSSDAVTVTVQSRTDPSRLDV